MARVWYRQDREAVLAALRRGARPDMATTMACGPLDELVALHEELGILATLSEVAVPRQRAGLDDALLLRTLATLPFLPDASLSGSAGALFREPAILLQLGWAPAQIRAGANGRHRHPDGRQPASLPCHPDTLRDELRRVTAPQWEQVQRVGVQALYARRLVRGQVYAIDGSGLGPDRRVVTLVCVSGERPGLVAWRLLTGSASEKGKEAAVTRALVEQAPALGGPGCIRLLLGRRPRPGLAPRQRVAERIGMTWQRLGLPSLGMAVARVVAFTQLHRAPSQLQQEGGLTEELVGQAAEAGIAHEGQHR